MRAKERESWVADNVGKGGKSSSYNAYNKSFKGFERNPSAPEFASSKLEGYHHYEANQDLTKNDHKQKDSSVNNNSASKSSKANPSNNIARNLVSKVVTVSVGSVMVVSTYNAVIEEQKANTPPAIAVEVSTNWKWSEDKETVVLEILEDGTLVREIPADVLKSVEDPTCTIEGTITYTATAEDGDKTYTDVQTEFIEPTGHSIGEGKEVTLENGETGMEFECDNCHEKFTITTSAEEND